MKEKDGMEAGGAARAGRGFAANMTRRGFLSAAGLGLTGLVLGLSGCGGSGAAGSASANGSAADAGSATSSQKAEHDDPVQVRVASLKGPTSIGLVSFMNKAKQDASAYRNTYDFQISASADEILPQLIKGDVDVALIPANAASVVYNKTKGAVTCLNVNTLGVLSVVTGDGAVTTFDALADHTVYLNGKGATPEYVMNYLLSCTGLADKVTLEFKSEATEVVSVLAADPTAVGVLPQPFATAATVKNKQLHMVVDLTDVWNKVQDASDSAGKPSQLVTGVTVVRNAFLEEHRDAVREFLLAQKDSVKTANADPAAAAQLVVDAGIIDSAAVAEQAIPACHLVCLTDDELKDALSGYLQVLHNADPASVGGTLPAEDFYYQAIGG